MGQRSDLNDKPTHKDFSSQPGTTPDELVNDIRETRDELGETVEHTKERLSTEHIKSEIRDATIGKAKKMIDRETEKAKRVAASAAETVKRSAFTRTITENPIPSAMIAFGIAWLLLKGPRKQAGSADDRMESLDERWELLEEAERRQSFGEGARATIADVKEKAGQVLERTRGKTAETADRVRKTASEMVEAAREKAARLAVAARERTEVIGGLFQNVLRERPLAVAAGLFVVGMIIGFSIPQTEREHKLMGETRDKLVAKAKEAAQDTIKKVGHVAQEVQRTAGEKAKEEGLV